MEPLRSETLVRNGSFEEPELTRRGRYMDVQPELDGRIRTTAGEDQRGQLT
jgi:hypothetical protein